MKCSWPHRDRISRKKMQRERSDREKLHRIDFPLNWLWLRMRKYFPFSYEQQTSSNNKNYGFDCSENRIPSFDAQFVASTATTNIALPWPSTTLCGMSGQCDKSNLFIVHNEINSVAASSLRTIWWCVPLQPVHCTHYFVLLADEKWLV